MKIAVMSDTHDNIWNVRRAPEIVKDCKAEAIIHCSDIIIRLIIN
ncbi:MAG: metallophosphoesterase family protein [Desulfobacterales bacterium]